MSYPVPSPVIQIAAVTVPAGSAGPITVAPVYIPRSPNGIELSLNLTNAGTDLADTLDVKVQTKIGGNWVDVAYFAQMTGTGGTKQFMAKLMPQTAFSIGDVAAALTAGNVRHLIGDEWQVLYTVVDANSNSAFVFNVTGRPI
jgi:hypothetical protein